MQTVIVMSSSQGLITLSTAPFKLFYFYHITTQQGANLGSKQMFSIVKIDFLKEVINRVAEKSQAIQGKTKLTFFIVIAAQQSDSAQ